MNKIILGIFIGVIVGLFAGYFISTKFLSDPIKKGYVRVTVSNKSGHDIKSLKLKHEQGSIEMKSLSNQECVDLIFKNIGENLYQIIATLDNDSTISSNGEYVEDGYRMTETIFKNSIKIERNTY